MHADWLDFFDTESSAACEGDLEDEDCLGDQTVMVRLTAEDITAGNFTAVIRYYCPS